MKGVHSTIGYVSFIERPPAESNSPLVDILLNSGAVLYVKTNLPQTLMVSQVPLVVLVADNVSYRQLIRRTMSLAAC